MTRLRDPNLAPLQREKYQSILESLKGKLTMLSEVNNPKKEAEDLGGEEGEWVEGEEGAHGQGSHGQGDAPADPGAIYLHLRQNDPDYSTNKGDPMVIAKRLLGQAEVEGEPSEALFSDAIPLNDWSVGTRTEEVFEDLLCAVQLQGEDVRCDVDEIEDERSPTFFPNRLVLYLF